MLAHYYAATFGAMQGSASSPASTAPASTTTPARASPRPQRRHVAEPLRIARLDARLLAHLLVRI